MLTDTEVLAYIFDYIVRKCSYPPAIAQRIATTAMAPPYWEDIDRMPPAEEEMDDKHKNGPQEGDGKRPIQHHHNNRQPETYNDRTQ